MNKAFVREAGSDDEDEFEQSLALPSGTRNYITPAGHARLKAELENLVKRERPHIVEIVSWAASNGDRSENGDKPRFVCDIPSSRYRQRYRQYAYCRLGKCLRSAEWL